MKKQYIYSALILTALLTAGCAKEMGNTLESSDSAAIELSSVSTDPMTKAVITGTSFTTDEATAGIGLSLLDKDGKAYGSNEPNVKYEFNSGKWTAASPLRVGNTEGNLVGYYPYSSAVSNVTAIPVASSINGTDYLYGSIAGLTSAKAKTESLTFSHALTRLRITFKLDNSFVGDGILSSLTIEGDGVAASGTVDATSGTITATKSAFTVSGLNATITATGITEDCLVVPAAASDTPQAVTLMLTVDDKAYKIDLKDDLAVKLQSGIQTDINLTVKNTSVTVNGSSIGAWGEGGSQTVTVGGNYKVTVKLADDTPVKELFLSVYVEEENVKIEAYSKLNLGLWCSADDNSESPATSVSNGLYTFTISEITKDMVVTIGYITVSFDMNNSGMNGNFTAKPDDITKIGYNTTIKEPDRPSSDKYVFRGWYKDADCTEPWDYSEDKVTKSMTLYAKWAEDPTGGKINDYDYVKLGGYYWATENVGEVKDKDNNNMYIAHDATYGYYYTQSDNKALNAAKSWGGTWSLPSEAQWQALIDYCDWEWKTDYDYNGTKMNGMLVTGREGTYESGHSIFLPAAGVFYGSSKLPFYQGDHGYYWSTGYEKIIGFCYGNLGMGSNGPYDGIAVRPVSE